MTETRTGIKVADDVLDEKEGQKVWIVPRSTLVSNGDMKVIRKGVGNGDE